MEHRLLASTGIPVSAITFGAWAVGGWMWGGTDERLAVSAIQAAYHAGITTFDTAAVYGQGLSEILIGKALAGKRDQVRILTKFGLRWDTEMGELHYHSRDNAGRPMDIRKYAGKQSVIRECEESLRRLRTDHIDLYQHHRPDPTTPIEETMEALAILRDQGKILAAGVSNYSLDQWRQADAVIDVCANQVPYSMANRAIEKDLLPYAISHGKAVLPYSPLQRGILTGKILPGHHFADGDHRADLFYFKSPNHERIMTLLDKIRPMAESKNATLAQLVLAWTLRQPGITTVLAGARNPDQARENAGAHDIELSARELDTIAAALAQLQIERGV